MSCAIAVMAKAPVPGRCKTRLMPRLSPAQAAALSAAFLRDVTGNVQAASSDGSVAGFVAYAPAGAAALFDGMLAPGTGLLLADGNIDCPPGVRGFGRCLLHAVQTLLADGQQSVCVLNADSPNLPTAYLRQAALALAAPGNRVVLGPAEDGGYYLLGMKQAHAGLFADIDWSTERVCAQTIARADAMGLELVLLPPWYDVDEPASLDRLWADIAGDGVHAAATKTVLSRIYLT
jgi:rSAM/selenodomain-associated transferase 1